MNPARINILLVEDSPSDAALLQEALAQSDLGRFECTVVERWAEAAARLHSEPFDVLLLDLSLPDTTGRDTFLRARAEAPQIPIVVLTGIRDEAVALAALRHGIQDYLVKGQADGPLTARAIRYALERKQAEEALRQEREQLEHRVRERTAELSDANRALQAEIAQRQRAEEQRSHALCRLVEVQETERGRIARELHDELGQELTALQLGLKAIHKHRPLSPLTHESVSQMERLADRLLQTVQRLAWALRPATLDRLGLSAALERYAREWAGQSGVTLDFHSEGMAAQRVPPNVETALYRVAQEALTNVARHAKARRVSVLLERHSADVHLIVEDDGRGFDAEATLQAPDLRGKLGLLGMEERVRLTGGAFEIESQPGAGTTVFARVPLASAPTGT